MIDADARCAVSELERRLRPFVARRVSSPADVDDVVQDIYLRIQRALPSLRDDQRYGPWVYRIARSAIAEHRRARARHPIAEGDANDEPNVESEEEQTEAERMMAAYVGSLVATLPSPYREALTLTELEGMTQRDAAKMLGVSLSGMKSRVQRGRERLRTMVDECCVVALDVRGRVIDCEPRKGTNDCCP